MSTQSSDYVFPTEMDTSAKPRYLPPTHVDIGLLIVTVCGMITVIAKFSGIGILYSVVVLAVGVALYKRVRRGPIYDVLFVQPLINFNIWRHGQYLYRQPVERETSYKNGLLRRKPSAVLPAQLPDLWALKGGDEDLGVFHAQLRKTDATLCFGSGIDTATGNMADHLTTQLGLANLAKELLAISSLKVGVSYLMRKRPVNVRPYQHYLVSALHPGVFNAKQAEADDDLELWNNDEYVDAHLHEMNLERMNAASETDDVITAVNITTQRHGAIVRALKGNGSLSQRAVRELPIWSLQNAARRLLGDTGVQNPHTMTHLEGHALARTAWDISGEELPQYHKWLIDKLVAENPHEELPDTMWPRGPGSAIRAYEDCVEFVSSAGISSWTGTLIAHGMPAYSTPDAFRRLYLDNPALYFSIAYIGDVITSKKDVSHLDWLVELAHLVDEVRGRVTQKTSSIQREHELRTKAQELAASGLIQSGKLVVSATASSRQELSEELSRIQELLRSLQCSPYRLKGSGVQLPAAVTSWFAIDLL